jgi:hypothetical protein
MRIGTLLLAALLGVTAVSAFQLHRQLEAERARAIALAARGAFLEARVRELERQAAPPVRPTPPAEPPTPTTATRSAAPPSRSLEYPTVLYGPPGEARSLSPEQRASVRAFQERQRRLWQDPDYRAARVEMNRLALRQMYGHAAREIGLSSAEMDRVLTLVAEHQLSDPDGAEMPGTMTEGSPDEAQVRRWRERAEERQRAHSAKMRELLGDSRYEQWQAYERSLPERTAVRQLRYEMTVAGTPLDPGQEQALGRLLAAEERRAQDEIAATVPIATAMLISPDGVVTRSRSGLAVRSPEDELRQQRAQLDVAQRSVERIREAAASILTEEQLVAFMQQRDASLTAQRASLQIQETRARVNTGESTAPR